MNVKVIARVAGLAAVLLSSVPIFAQAYKCGSVPSSERAACERVANYEAKCASLTGGDLTKCSFEVKQGYCADDRDPARCKALVELHGKCRAQSGEDYAVCMRSTKILDR